MADPISAQHIQFGNEISPAKTGGTTVYSTANKAPSESEKDGDYDLEDRAYQIANSDFNSRKKQVCRFFTVSHVLGEIYTAGKSFERALFPFLFFHISMRFLK